MHVVWNLRYDVGLVNLKHTPKRPTDEHAAEADMAWVRAALDGDMAAFETLVRHYRNDVFALSYHFVRNREDAWDLSQEVFIKAYRALSRFRGEAGFKTWLLRIAANHAKDFLKKKRLEIVPFNDALNADAESVGADPGRRLEMTELGQAIDGAVAELPVKQRTAFILREFEDMSYQEMAEVMQCSMGTVMSRLHHARKKLQQALKKKGIVKES